MPETVVAKVANLILDEENPRISQPNTGQRAALQAVAEHQGKKLLALASDIVEHGISPSDLLIVTGSKSPGRYRVLEGNRRLTALKALENPEWLDGHVPVGVLKQMRRLAKAYADDPIEDVLCAVVKDRDEAYHWIELKHTGENAGAGLVPWGADESARFKKRGPEIPSP